MKIQTIAPSRISLFGGGTDLSPYCDLYGGICINMAISLRQKITMYSGTPDIFELPDNIFPINANPDLFYAIFKKYGIDGGHLTKIQSEFDGRIGAGLGSSASACVALIGAINKRKELGIKQEDIAQAAWEAEEQLMGWHGGKQDQWASVYGGLNVFTFGVLGKNGVSVMQLSSDFSEKIYPYILLFDTGGNRSSHEIQNGFLELSEEQIQKLDEIKEIAKFALSFILREEIEPLGELLHKAWEVKKKSNKGITTSRINDLYYIARGRGAIGGKILGAGGCGYMIFWVPPERQDAVINRLEKEDCEHILYYPDIYGLQVKEL